MKDKGFTLVELLIVMAIIGILIAIAIVGLGAAQADARNSARETAVKGIAGLLETYYGANGQSYPSQISVPNSGLVTFTSTSGTQYSTSSNLCKATIDPVNSGFNGSTCSSVITFSNAADGGTGHSSNSNTQYFYVPYQNGNAQTGSISGSVTGYLVGACLENGTIFAYTSNGSNAPYTQTGPNSIKFPSGITYTCS
jgi:prepilin-type N-terminal cleavage/methylation domain-containing protein